MHEGGMLLHFRSFADRQRFARILWKSKVSNTRAGTIREPISQQPGSDGGIVRRETYMIGDGIISTAGRLRSAAPFDSFLEGHPKMHPATPLASSPPIRASTRSRDDL